MCCVYIITRGVTSGLLLRFVRGVFAEWQMELCGVFGILPRCFAASGVCWFGGLFDRRAEIM